MKICRYCNKQFPPEDFGVAKTTEKKVYRRRKCKFCYYQTKKKLRDFRYIWLDKLKKSEECGRCGLKDHRVLDFHHKDGSSKSFSIANGVVNGMNIDRLQTEINKCVILCSNCHRIVHYGIKKNGA